MSTLFFVRHVEHVLQHQVLLGRRDDAPLSSDGLKQLGHLLDRLRDEPATAIYSSPRQRARATAEVIASAHGLPVQICKQLDELDYGDWSGRPLDELARDPKWQRWNTARSKECPPNGEGMRALQERIVKLAEELAHRHLNETLICVTHAEPIRALMLHVCGMPLDEFAQVDVPPGSITPIRVFPESRLLQCVDEAIPA
jgi:broad specificity phosphatase PhoE